MTTSLGTFPARRRVALFAMLLVAVVAAVMLVASSPAQADPLPQGTFQIGIVSWDGYCVSRVGIVDLGQIRAVANGCDPADPTQRFNYNPQTQQIVAQTDPPTCLAERKLLDAFLVEYQPCIPDYPDNRLQRFQRNGPNSSGQYVITATAVLNTGFPFCMMDQGGTLQTGPCLSSDPRRVSPTLLFTFIPLV